MDSSLLVLQHIACEPPAAFEDELRSRGLDVARVELDEGEPLPDWREFPAIVVMGGPMGAYDEAAHPWLVEEKRLLREAVEADVPVWGVCLGAQLLASALGARVYRGEQPEVGCCRSSSRARRPRTRCSATRPAVPDAPMARRQLRPPGWRHAARRLPGVPASGLPGGPPYGLQFHIEVSLELATEWAEVPAYAQSLESTLGPGALDRLLADVAGHEDVTVPLARRLFGRWLEHVVRVPAAHAGS